jgi:hypothetical protein
MTALTTLNVFGYFERRSQLFSNITFKSFVRIPCPWTLYCVTRGVLFAQNIWARCILEVCFCGNCSLCLLATLVWMEINEAKQTTVRFRTVRESLDALLSLHVMPLRDFFFNLNWNKTNTTFPISVPRITAVDEWDNYSQTLKTSQMLLFWSPVLSGNYEIWGGTHANNPLKTKEILQLIRFLHHRDAWDDVLWSTGKETF